MLVIKLDSRGGMNWFFFMNHILYSLQSQTKALSHQDVHRWKKEAPVPGILLYLPFIPLTRSSHISSLPLPGKGSTKISEKDTCRMNTGTDFLVCWTVSLSWDLLPWQGWDALMFAMTETTTSPLWVMTDRICACQHAHPFLASLGGCLRFLPALARGRVLLWPMALSLGSAGPLQALFPWPHLQGHRPHSSRSNPWGCSFVPDCFPCPSPICF